MVDGQTAHHRRDQPAAAFGHADGPARSLCAGQPRGARLYRRRHPDLRNGGIWRALSDEAVAFRQAGPARRDRPRRQRCSMSARAPAIRPPCCRGLAKSVVALESDAIRLPTRRHRRLPALAATMFRSCAASSRPATRPARPMTSLSSEAASMSLPRSAYRTACRRRPAGRGRGARRNAGVARIYLKSNGVATGRRAFNAAVKSLPGFERTPAFEF